MSHFSFYVPIFLSVCSLPAALHRMSECVSARKLGMSDVVKCDFCQQGEEQMGGKHFIKTYPKSRPDRHTHTPMHTLTHLFTGRQSHHNVSFIGADTLQCSSEWDLMSEAPAYDSPTGQPLIKVQNGAKGGKGTEEMGGEDEGGGKDADLIHSVLLCSE